VAVHRFTDKWLQSGGIIPPSGRIEFADATCPCLHLRVTAKGTRSFSVMLRLGGTLHRETLGKYPRMTLRDAREAALLRLRAVDEGWQALTPAMSLQQLIDAYVERHLKPNTRSWKNIRAALLGSSKRPSRLEHLLARKVIQVAKCDVIAVLDCMMAEGKPQAAVNLLRYIKMAFNWAADRDVVPANPFERIRPPARTEERDRVLTDAEIVAIWRASFQLMAPYGQMYRMLFLTGQRRSEVANMRWSEVMGETWTLPRERTKKDRAHTIPLTGTALKTLASLSCYGAESFVFTTTGGVSASSNFAKVKREIDRMSGTCGWRNHDIRRTVRSKLAELRVPETVARKVLNHEQGKVDRIYNRYDYLDEKREALERWEKMLLGLAR